MYVQLQAPPWTLRLACKWQFYVMTGFITQENGYIFRIVHRENLPVILTCGLSARNAPTSDPNYVNIGSLDLINRRGSRTVPIGHRGVLNDYVPFYFTPFSPMAYNIKTGWNGIVRRHNDDILLLVSSFSHVEACGLPIIFTDRHAYLNTAEFFEDSSSSGMIDWGLLRSKNFRKDAADPERVERYQAEALIYRHVPLTGLLGIAVHSERVQAEVQADVDRVTTNLKIRCLPGWYF